MNVLKSNLSFEYICSCCGSKLPIFRYRCDNCLSLLSVVVNFKIIRKNNNERYITF